MILYHGSNVKVENPQIIQSKRLLDFGTAFYLTSDYEQAKKWAVRTTARREEGEPLISVFDVAIDELESQLNVCVFPKANEEWLRYISKNRTDKNYKDDFDIVIGPVANDQAIRTINQYLKGYFNEEIALKLLLPQNLKDQYAFKTEEALNYLNFKEVIKG